MLTHRIIVPAIALLLISTHALANPRRSLIDVHPVGVSSIAMAAASGRQSTASTDEGLTRDNSREAKHAAMVDAMAAEIRAKLRAAARKALKLPHISGTPTSGIASVFGFNGLSNLDQANVNLGFSVEPPDQALCVGNGFVFEGVNDAFAVYSEDGQLVSGPAQANAFFGVDFLLNVSDPRCIYDTASNRWFVTMIEYNNSFTDNHLKIAVSKTGDPTGSFTTYDINVTNDGGDVLPSDCPCLGDQPLIGADANGFYISTNAFGISTFRGALIYALSKAQLAQGGGVRGVLFDQLSLPGGEFPFSIQPSTTPSHAKFAKNTEFLAQSMGLFKAEDSLAVWSINNTSALDGDLSKLSISLVVTPTQVYVVPVPASQKAGPTPRAEADSVIDSFPGTANEQLLDGNDQRLQQVTYLNGQLFTTVGTASTTEGAPVRDAVAWFVLNVSNDADGLAASVAKQGYLAGPDSSHLLYPAMAVNSKGEAAMVFTLTGPQFFPSAAFWRLGANAIHIVAEGKAPEDGFSAYEFARPRWGDYSAAAVGSDDSIWMATEWIPGGARKRAANWGTFIATTDRGAQDD